MNSSQHTLLCHYRYDPLDRLTSHAQSDTSQHHRFYCRSRLASEIRGAIGYSIVQHGDLLLAQLQRENDAIDTTLLATDLQRSVLHTLKNNTERQPIAYSPYGHRRAESGLTSLLGFNGERPDPVTGHYLLGNGYRAFNPMLMRFNSPDSLSPFGKGGLNSYAYCEGNPANFTDPTGNFLKSITNFFRSTRNGAKSPPSKLHAELNTVANSLDKEYEAFKAIKNDRLISEQTKILKEMHAVSKHQKQELLETLIHRLDSRDSAFVSGYNRALHNTAFGYLPVDLPRGVSSQLLYDIENKLHPSQFVLPNANKIDSEMRILKYHIDVAHQHIRGTPPRAFKLN